MNNKQKEAMWNIRKDTKAKVSKLKKQIYSAKAEEATALANIANEERETISKMLEILNKIKTPMIARDIENQLLFKGYALSSHAIAGNLLAMRCGTSRFHSNDRKYDRCLREIDNLPAKGTIIVKGGKRTATFAELDEAGNVIPNTIYQRTVKAPNTYEIKK